MCIANTNLWIVYERYNFLFVSNRRRKQFFLLEYKILFLFHFENSNSFKSID